MVLRTEAAMFGPWLSYGMLVYITPRAAPMAVVVEGIVCNDNPNLAQRVTSTPSLQPQ